jgi:WD40 repeat protein
MRNGNGIPQARDPQQETKVFVSYSRKDREFVTRMADDLETRGIEVFRDTEDILPTEEWRTRLRTLIGQADTVLFVISPNSAASPECHWELDYARSLNKRFATIVYEEVAPDTIPEYLSSLNYIFFTPSDDFQRSLEHLVTALNTDIGWIREHTRLGLLARRWDGKGRPGSQVLRGDDLSAAEQWIAARPKGAPAPTEVHREYIKESRDAATRRLRYWVTGSLSVAVLTLVLAFFALVQRQNAIEQRTQAEQERDRALTTESRFLADLSRQQSEADNPVTGMLLALEALPDQKHSIKRPFVPEAQRSLYSALQRNRKLAVSRVHDYSVDRVILSPDGTRMVTVSVIGDSLLLWDSGTGRLVSELKGHRDMVVSVAFSPDARSFVTGSWDNTARLWNAESGELIAVLEAHTSAVNHVCFSPDGKQILTSSHDGTARLWDVESKQTRMTLESHNGNIYRATFSPDGTRILTDAYETSRLWNAKTGAGIAVLKKIIVPTEARFSPDSARVVSISKDKTARLWDAATGRELAVLKGHRARINQAVFSPDGRRLVTVSGDLVSTPNDNTARIWDAGTGAHVAVLRGHTKLVDSAVFSPNGSTLVTVSWDHSARLWNAATGAAIAALTGHNDTINDTVFNPDGTRLVTVSDDQTATVWDAGSGARIAVLRGHSAPVKRAIYSPDGLQILTVTGSETHLPFDFTARLWDARTGALLAVLDHDSNEEHAGFNPDGISIYTVAKGAVHFYSRTAGPRFSTERSQEKIIGSTTLKSRETLMVTARAQDYAVIIWNAASGEEIRRLTGHTGEVLNAGFSPDRTHIATASADKTVRIWETGTGKLMTTLMGHSDKVYSTAWSPDGKRLLTQSSDSTARVWDAETEASVVVFEGQQGRLANAFFSPDGTRMVTLSGDYGASKARLLETSSWKSIAEVNNIGNAAFSPHGALVVMASPGEKTQVLNTQTGKQIIEFGPADSVSFSPDAGRMALVEPGYPMAKLLDTKTWKVIGELEGEWAMRKVTFSPDGKRVMTQSSGQLPEQHAAKLWGAETGAAIIEFTCPDVEMTDAAFCPSGTHVVTACSDHAVRVWDVHTGKETAAFSGDPVRVVTHAGGPDGTWLIQSAFADSVHVWRILPTTQALVDLAKEAAPQCLSAEQRKKFFIDPEPPKWCLELGKWPFK